MQQVDEVNPQKFPEAAEEAVVPEADVADSAAVQVPLVAIHRMQVFTADTDAADTVHTVTAVIFIEYNTVF